jgi:hypothetical protein
VSAVLRANVTGGRRVTMICMRLSALLTGVFLVFYPFVIASCSQRAADKLPLLLQDYPILQHLEQALISCAPSDADPRHWFIPPAVHIYEFVLFVSMFTLYYQRTSCF